jgi:integrase
MPVYRDKQTGRFFIQFQWKGEAYKERLPKGITRKQAERREIKVKAQMLDPTDEAPKDDCTFETFIQEYYLPLIEKNRVQFEKAIYVCKAALVFLKGRPMRSIKHFEIEQFKQSRFEKLTQHGTARKPATVLRELSIISKIFSLAVKNEICDYNPCSRVDKPSFNNVQNRILRREDEQKFFANMRSQWAKDICKMVLLTGLRQNDLMRLTRFQVNRDERIITLVQSKTQNRLECVYDGEAIEIIERRWSIKGSLLFASPKTGTENGSVRHAMMRACDRAGIPRVTIRDLRRTFATRGLEDGNDSVTVADALGHSSLRMIQRYVRSTENKRKLAASAANLPAAKLRKVK